MELRGSAQRVLCRRKGAEKKRVPRERKGRKNHGCRAGSSEGRCAAAAPSDGARGAAESRLGSCWHEPARPFAPRRRPRLTGAPAGKAQPGGGPVSMGTVAPVARPRVHSRRRSWRAPLTPNQRCAGPGPGCGPAQPPCCSCSSARDRQLPSLPPFLLNKPALLGFSHFLVCIFPTSPSPL